MFSVAVAVISFLIALLGETTANMAQADVNGAGQTPPELPDEVNKPPEGVILPPKDIRGKLSMPSRVGG